MTLLWWHFLVLKLFSTSVFSSLSESFFMVKGAALFLQQGGSTQGPKTPTHHKHAGGNTHSHRQKKLCFFLGFLGHILCTKKGGREGKRKNSNNTELQEVCLKVCINYLNRGHLISGWSSLNETVTITFTIIHDPNVYLGFTLDHQSMFSQALYLDTHLRYFSF